MSDFRKDVFFANGGSDHHTAEQNREMTEWQDSEITRLQDNLVDVTQERDLIDSLSVDQKALIDRLQEQALELGAEIESLKKDIRETGQSRPPKENTGVLRADVDELPFF